MTSDRSPSPAQPDLPGPRSPATPYRMTVTTALAHADAVALADQRLGAWLKQEGCEEPPPTEPARGGPDAPAERLRLGDRVLLDRDDGPLRAAPDSPAGPGRYTRRRLRTPAPHGTHQLTLTLATDPDGPTWVRLEAEYQACAPGVRTPSKVPVPELARTLLPLLDASDGPAAVHNGPRVITAAGVADLIDELCDPERRLPTVVASVPANLELDDWVTGTVRPLCHQLPGLATLYVLDPAARTEFNVALEYHAVYGGAVRTYLPEVDPASRYDGARHPVMPRHRIEEDLRRAAGLLAREPRRLAAELPLPAPLAAVPVLRVPVPARRAEAGAPEQPAARGPVRSGSGHEGAAPGGGAADHAPDQLAHEQRLDDQDQQARADELELVRHSLRHSRRREHHLRAESEEQYATLRHVGAQVRVLAGRLCPGGAPGQGQRPATGPGRTPREAGGGEAPASFAELLDRLPEFPLLTFTGDQKSALALDGLGTCAGWARLTWEGLTALQEYAVAAVRGEAGGDFKQWCEHTPDGCHHFPPRKAVRGESQTVFSHTKWKRERMLPVPECVDASRRAFMGAHLRIGGGRTAPRLHYLDDCSGSGRIYVGYIGLHLTNTRTN
ncbi:hypothetical protein [Kitasatospora sp. NPDC057015]|uniref:hypothetical protein n=1 Tax=Kitasatospora sp. NPDC057015 TaxID=3346001 RepID=UPI003627E19D